MLALSTMQLGPKNSVLNPWNFHILSPALAALAAMAVVVILRIEKRGKWTPATVGIAVAILIFIWGFGFNNNLKRLYRSIYYDDYLLGLRLRELTEPGDLVVTADMDYGSPINIYYSRQRGWVYPQPDHRWISLFDDQEAAIQELERFRSEGADWLGFETERKEQFWRDYPQLAAHIEQSSFLVEENDEYVIFRFKDSVH